MRSKVLVGLGAMFLAGLTLAAGVNAEDNLSAPGPTAADVQKLREQSATDVRTDTGRASSESEEAALQAAAAAVPDRESPGLFTSSSGHAIVRVFAMRTCIVRQPGLRASTLLRVGADLRQLRCTQSWPRI